MNESAIPTGTKTAEARPESALYAHMAERSNFFFLSAVMIGFGTVLCFYKVHGRGINVLVYTLMWLFFQHTGLRRLNVSVPGKSLVPVAGSILLAISVCWTANDFVQTTSCIGILLLVIMHFLDAFTNTDNWPLRKYIHSAFHLLFAALGKITSPFYHMVRHKGRRSTQIKYILLGLAVAVPLCFAALALLSSADRIFGDWVYRAFHSTADLSDFFRDTLKILLLFAVGFFLFYCGFAAQCDRPPAESFAETKRAHPTIAVVFTAALALIYLAFCAVQIRFLFTGQASALPDGYTYAEYAREGFFQLLFVSGCNLLLVLLCIGRFGTSRALNILLTVISGCTYVMALSSAWRMILYVQVYGLTFLRILVLWFLFVLAIWLGFTVASIYSKRICPLRVFLLSGLVLWLLFAFAQPDRLAAEYNFKQFGPENAPAVSNALYDLSMDAVPVMAQYSHNGTYKCEWRGYLEHSVPEQFDSHGIRTFNIAIWQANKAVEVHYAAEQP